jgi:formamidase
VTIRIAVAADRSIAEDPTNSHNRWTHDLEPVASVAPGDEVVVECRDGMNGRLADLPANARIEDLELHLNHPLTGPIEVRGAEPGDLLVVETLAIEPGATGATAVIPSVGLLGDLFDEIRVFKWEIADGYARCADLPGVAVRGAPFVGNIGVAPSEESARAATARETTLHESGAVALLPDDDGAVPARRPAATAGLRTVPPRENGGNLDVKQVAIGSRLLLPVQVPGAFLSLGDVHFAQGDGEVCGTAIEIAATVTLRVGLERRAVPGWTPRLPMVEFTESRSPDEAPRRFVATMGIPVDSQGTNLSMDTTLAARQALLELVDYVAATRGYTREQAYVLASVAADLRISEAVNVPNCLVTAALPLDVFEY